jgi:hypothetical protein
LRNSLHNGPARSDRPLRHFAPFVVPLAKRILIEPAFAILYAYVHIASRQASSSRRRFFDNSLPGQFRLTSPEWARHVATR